MSANGRATTTRIFTRRGGGQHRPHSGHEQGMAATSKPALSGFARALIQHGHLKEADAIACTIQAGEAATAFILEVSNRSLMSCGDGPLRGRDLRLSAARPGRLRPGDASRASRSTASCSPSTRWRRSPSGQSRSPSPPPTRPTCAHSTRSASQTGLQLELVIVEADKLWARGRGPVRIGRRHAQRSSPAKPSTWTCCSRTVPPPRDEDEANEVDDAPGRQVHPEGADRCDQRGRIRTSTSSPTRSSTASACARTASCATSPSRRWCSRKDRRAHQVISRLDISEKRVPQDGRMKLVLSRNKAIDFRVHAPDPARREDRDAHPIRARRCSASMRSATTPSRRGAARRRRAPLRHDPGHRPTRGSGKTVSWHLPQPAQQAGGEHLHCRGSGRDQPRRHQPGQRQREGRPHLLRRASAPCARTRT